MEIDDKSSFLQFKLKMAALNFISAVSNYKVRLQRPDTKAAVNELLYNNVYIV